MKKPVLKSVSMLFLILLLSQLALASTLYKEDFEGIQSQTFNLKEKDTVRIHSEGKDTEIMLRDVLPEDSRVKLTVFIEGAETPQYMTVSTSNKVLIDINKDNIKDFAVQPVYISSNNTVLSITKLQQSPQDDNPQSNNQITGKTEQEINKSPNILIGVYIAIAIIIIGLIAYLILRKKPVKPASAS